MNSIHFDKAFVHNGRMHFSNWDRGINVPNPISRLFTETIKVKVGKKTVHLSKKSCENFVRYCPLMAQETLGATLSKAEIIDNLQKIYKNEVNEKSLQISKSSSKQEKSLPSSVSSIEEAKLGIVYSQNLKPALQATIVPFDQLPRANYYCVHMSGARQGLPQEKVEEFKASCDNSLPIVILGLFPGKTESQELPSQYMRPSYKLEGYPCLMLVYDSITMKADLEYSYNRSNIENLKIELERK